VCQASDDPPFLCAQSAVVWTDFKMQMRSFVDIFYFLLYFDSAVRIKYLPTSHIFWKICHFETMMLVEPF